MTNQLISPETVLALVTSYRKSQRTSPTLMQVARRVKCSPAHVRKNVKALCDEGLLAVRSGDLLCLRAQRFHEHLDLLGKSLTSGWGFPEAQRTALRGMVAPLVTPDSQWMKSEDPARRVSGLVEHLSLRYDDAIKVPVLLKATRGSTPYRVERLLDTAVRKGWLRKRGEGFVPTRPDPTVAPARKVDVSREAGWEPKVREAASDVARLVLLCG